MIKIVFYAPYPEILPVIEQVFRERPESECLQYEVIQDFYNNSLDCVEADAVIARGFTAHTLIKRNIPCAELKSTGYDVLTAVRACMDLGNVKRIAVVGAFNMVYGAEQINEVYPLITVNCYGEDNETKLEQAVKQAAMDGNQVIVGGYSTAQIAGRYRLPCVVIRSGIEAVNNAISEAVAVARLTRYEREKRGEIANIMNHSFQGIISAGRQGIITLANTYCYTLMKGRTSSIVGMDIGDVFPGLPVWEVIRGGRKILSEIYEYEKQKVMVNCVPVKGESEEFGCVLTFQSVDQIQAEERKLRTRMRDTGFVAKYHFSNILYRDQAMGKVVDDGIKFSYADSNILIYGETGTGKELFAQSIHNSSKRKSGPFVAINCAALPENLLESELFGYVEGAFTGAFRGGKMGYFEIAHRGTIFLDEIGDISPRLQSRLLRVLQEREIVRLGSDTVIPVDVRVICATNKDLNREVEQGDFRQDLLYRLDVLELNIPPLRERRGDIGYMVDRMIGFEHERTGSVLEQISGQGKDLLDTYRWPGNVREVKNFSERICILCTKKTAGAEDVLKALPGLAKSMGREKEGREDPDRGEDRTHRGDPDRGERQDSDRGERQHLDRGERQDPDRGDPRELGGGSRLLEAQRRIIIDALEINGYNKTKTAQYLEMDKSTLWRKMKKCGLDGNKMKQKYNLKHL